MALTYVPVIKNNAPALNVGTLNVTSINFGPSGGPYDTPIVRTGPNALNFNGFFAMSSGQASGGFTAFTGAAQALKCGTAGGGIAIKEGTNARQGVVTLVAGTATVANTSVTATTRIILTSQSLGTVTSPKAIGVTARTPGASFVVSSADPTDTSVIAYVLFEPAS